MRKLGITIAALAVAALGLVGFATSPASASGHEGTICPAFTGNPVYENAGSDPTPAGGDPGEPLVSTLEGAEKACTESTPSPLLCGIAKGLDNRPGTDMRANGATGTPLENPGSATAGALNDGLAENVGDPFKACDVEPNCTSNCGGNQTTTTTSGGGGGTDDEVLANNAAADGGLPRTGGELFAGAGLGLAALAGLVRRFVR